MNETEARRILQLSESDDFVQVKKNSAQVKLVVERVQANKKHRPYSIKAELEFYLRVNKDAEENWTQGKEQNLKIAELLNRYEEVLSK